MNDVPTDDEEPDEVDDAYRRASALDSSGPSDLARRRILNHAAQLAAERGAENAAAGISRRGAASQSWRRPAIFGTLAAAALAGLLITPRFFEPQVSVTAATSDARVARPSAAMPAAPTDQSEGRPLGMPANEQPQSPRAAEQGVPEPQAFARNAAPSTNSAAQLAAKNAPARAPSMAGARSSVEAGVSATAGDRVNAEASRVQAMSGARSAAPPAAPAGLFGPAAELRRAAETGDIAKLQMLLDKPPHVEKPNGGDQRGGVDKQSLVEVRDAGGRTALMLATLQGQDRAVDVLLAHGADPNAADAHGATPMQVAMAAGRESIAAALQRAGAR